MIQRLLRGRIFYVVLTGFVLAVFYYGRAVHLGSWFPSELPSVLEQPPAEEEWWHEEFDVVALQQAAAVDPLLRVMLFMLTLFVGGMTCGGIGLTIWAVVTGRLRGLWRGPSHRPPAWHPGELVRITLLIVLVGFLLQFARVAFLILLPGWAEDLNLWLNVSMVLLDGLVLLAIFAFASSKAVPARRALGLSARTFSRAVSTGFRGYVAVFPWLLLLLWLIVESARTFGFKPPVQPIYEMIFMEQRPVVLGLTIFLVCLLGPFAEELFFRGVLFATLRQRTSRWVAVLVSGALFSLVHTNLIGFLPILLLGCLLADLYERTGSLAGPIAIHILHNTFLLTLALTYRWAV